MSNSDDFLKCAAWLFYGDEEADLSEAPGNIPQPEWDDFLTSLSTFPAEHRELTQSMWDYHYNI